MKSSKVYRTLAVTAYLVVTCKDEAQHSFLMLKQLQNQSAALEATNRLSK